MPVRNIHRKPFDDGTVAKLELYRDYLRAWLPTFIYTPSVKILQIFDFFAGPGHDIDGKLGSPLVASEEVRRALEHKKTGATPRIKLFFNDFDHAKATELRKILAADEHAASCVTTTVACQTFDEVFCDWTQRMTEAAVANLVFIDQNGVKHITREIFLRLVGLPRTDFLFFISSAIVNRFREQAEIRDRVPVTDADLDRMNGTNVHRILAESYRRWLPDQLKYFIAPFSIRKGPNVYGLVFGSAHPLGMEKFLQVTWKRGGDANFDIDEQGIDPTSPFLFEEMNRPKKIVEFENDLRQAVLSGKLRTHKEIYEYGLANGVLASHSRDILKRMVEREELPKQTFNVSYAAWAKPGLPKEIVLKGGRS
jgi:three-Cys-motif partner protein